MIELLAVVIGICFWVGIIVGVIKLMDLYDDYKIKKAQPHIAKEYIEMVIEDLKTNPDKWSCINRHSGVLRESIRREMDFGTILVMKNYGSIINYYEPAMTKSQLKIVKELAAPIFLRDENINAHKALKELK